MSSARPDLVVLHGWGVNRCVWEALQRPLAKHFRVRALNLPGFGGTPALDNYSLSRLAEHVLERVPAGACWLGWSLGAQVALQAALQAPQRIDRLVLVSATPRFMQAPDWPHGVEAVTMQRFCDDLAADYGAALVRFFLLQAARVDASSRRLARDIARTVAGCGQATREALSGCLEVLAATDLRPQLVRIATPALVIHGDQDRVTPWAAGAQLATALTSARLVTLPAGHAPFLSQPERFLDELLAA